MSETKRLTRQEAERQVRLHGYVRVEEHTATDLDQLDRLYNVILPKMDEGSYSTTPDPGTAMRAAKELKAVEEAVVPAKATTETKKA